MSLAYEKVDGECGALLQKHFVSCFRKGYLRAKGCIVPQNFSKFGQKVLDLEVRDEDVWVCSFPKTGTTWTQEMVWLLGNDLDYEAAKVILPGRFPFLEHTALFDYEDAMKADKELCPEEHVLDSVGFVDRAPSPRFVKSHLPLQLLPNNLQSRATRAKIIYTYRNPKDTCLSYYHHCRAFEGYTGTFDDFLLLFLKDSLCFAPYPEHVMGFLALKNDPNALILAYEDMKQDLMAVIKRTAEFLGKSYTEEELVKLKEHLSFEAMRSNPAVNYEHVMEFNRRHNLIVEEGRFLRKGKAGEWLSAMSPETAQDFDHWIQKRFKEFPQFWVTPAQPDCD